MSEVIKFPSLALCTWNIAASQQARRVGAIAEYLASRDPGVTILTELTATKALEKALNREIGTSYILGAVATGSAYEDSIGLLITDPGCEVVDDIEAVATGGNKMPYIMKARLATPLGEVSMAAMRGAYVSGKGGLFSSGSTERKAQYRTAIEEVEGADGVSLVGGDMNSLVRTHDPIFAQAGFRRLTTQGITWPDREGVTATTKDAVVLSLPFLLMRRGISLDAIYGKGPVESTGSSANATGLSDHMYLESRVVLAA